MLSGSFRRFPLARDLLLAECEGGVGRPDPRPLLPRSNSDVLCAEASVDLMPGSQINAKRMSQTYKGSLNPAGSTLPSEDRLEWLRPLLIPGNVG